MFVGHVGDCEGPVRRGVEQKHADDMKVFRSKLQSKAGDKKKTCLKRERGAVKDCENNAYTHT